MCDRRQPGHQQATLPKTAQNIAPQAQKTTATLSELFLRL